MRIEAMQRQLKRMALLDAGICQEWQYRYFSYDSGWGPGEHMASMRDGCGSHWFVLFGDNTCAYKIYDIDYRIDIDGIKQFFPKDAFYDAFMKEPAFSTNDVTQIGYLIDGKLRSFGNDVQGAISVQEVLEWDVVDYAAWSRQYYEIELTDSLYAELWEDPSRPEKWKAINADFDTDGFGKDILQIGWST